MFFPSVIVEGVLLALLAELYLEAPWFLTTCWDRDNKSKEVYSPALQQRGLCSCELGIVSVIWLPDREV